MQAQPSLCLCGVPENLNLNSLDLGIARNPGPASDSCRQSNLELSSVDWESTHHERGQTQCSQDTVSTRQGYLFAVLLRPQSTTE